MFLISNDFWEIRGAGHKGNGVFTKKKISAGTVIGDYLGTVINIAEYDLENDKKGLYMMSYADQAGIYPDFTKPGLHLINHSCEPNCWMYTYHAHTLFFALREIKAHEELTISYLLSPKDEMCNPCTHDCRCESAQCTGTMHLPKDKYDLWQKFQNSQMKKTKTAPFVFGEDLPKLDSYPTSIPVKSIYFELTSPKLPASPIACLTISV